MTGPEASRAYFADKAEAYRTSGSHANARELARMVTLLEERVGALAGRRALDVATGGGHTAVALARAGADVVATDILRGMVEAAAKGAAEAGARLFDRALVEAAHAPFRDAAFDVVACRIAPHHFPDLDAFVAECARVLVPGGALYVFDLTTPEGRPAARAVINRVERLRDPSHGDSFPPDAWRAALTGAGLDVAHLATTASTTPLEPWIARARMPPDREHALRALLAAPPVDLEGYGVVEGETMRMLRVEIVALKRA